MGEFVLNDDVRVLLAARTFGYRLFQSLFGNKPTEAQLEVVCKDLTREILGALSNDEFPRYGACLSAVFKALDTVAQDIPAAVDALHGEYMRALVGPGKMVSYPWESVHVTGENLLFQECTLRVRDAYRAQGFIPSEYPHVADDHLAIELDFMGQLALIIQEAYDGADVAEARKRLEGSARFLDEHLLVWAPLYAAGLEAIEHPMLYPQMAALMREFLVVDRELIGEVLASL